MELTFSAGPRSLYLSREGLGVFESTEEVMHVEPQADEQVFPRMYDELASAYSGDPSAYVTDTRRAERIMQVVDACYRSARDGKPVQLS